MAHAPAVRARPGLDAAQPAVRSGFVLPRRAAGGRRGRQDARRAADPARPGGAARADDDRVSRQPADAGDLSRRRADRHRARRAPALHRALPVRGVDRDDDRLRRCSECFRCEDDSHRRRRRASRAIGSSRRSSSRATASSTTSCSSAWPSGRSRWRSRREARDPTGGYDPLLERAHRGGAAGRVASSGVTIITNMGAANPRAGGAAWSRLPAAWIARPDDRDGDRRRRAATWSTTGDFTIAGDRRSRSRRSATARVGQRLHRRRADRRGAGAGAPTS